jgi:Flp pilus assembly pilin Flp
MCEDMTACVWRRLGAQDSGQDLLEYALLVALISLAVMATVGQAGSTIKTVLWDAIAVATDVI